MGMMSEKHYGIVASWMEKVALLLFASLVVQKIFLGAGLRDPILMVGIIVSFALYLFAFMLLLKS